MSFIVSLSSFVLSNVHYLSNDSFKGSSISSNNIHLRLHKKLEMFAKNNRRRGRRYDSFMAFCKEAADHLIYLVLKGQILGTFINMKKLIEL